MSPYTPVRASEVARYNSRPLPNVPSDQPGLYSSARSSASSSYESFIDHQIPSGTLCDQEEIHQIWSRASQHSILSNISESLTSRHSISEVPEVVAQSVRRRERRSSAQLQSLLPPALERQYDRCSVEASVPCRLSSTSTETLNLSPPSKRSVTPALLHKLSSDLDLLTLEQQRSSSVVFHSVAYSANSSSTTINMIDVSPETSPKTVMKKLRPANIFTSTGSGTRNISSPLPSPNYNSSFTSLQQFTDKDAATETAYRPLRPVPSIPTCPTTTPVNEVSVMEWDEDDLASKLARVKKSVGDLRAAAMKRNPVKDRKAEKAVTASEGSVAYNRPRAQRAMTEPTQAIFAGQIQATHPPLSRLNSTENTPASRLRTSLPPLLIRTSSTRAVMTPANIEALPTCSTSSPPAAPKISRKISVRVAAASATPPRKRATSDAPITHTLSLFPQTPAPSASTRVNRLSPSALPTPSSSPRSVMTTDTVISAGTTAVGSNRSRQSSVASINYNEKPLPNPHGFVSVTTHKRRGVKPALGNKRFSVLSFASVRSNARSTSGKRSATSASMPRTRVVGLGKFRRWWNWVSRCSTIPVVAGTTVCAVGAGQAVKAPRIKNKRAARAL